MEVICQSQYTASYSVPGPVEKRVKYAKLVTESPIVGSSQLSPHSSTYQYFNETNEASLAAIKNSSRMSSIKTDFTTGSTKGTGFIPGYQGHIPMASENPRLLEYEKQTRAGSYPKNIPSCSNHIPGYTGYQPSLKTDS